MRTIGLSFVSLKHRGCAESRKHIPFLQPCDAYIKTTFQCTIGETCDALQVQDLKAMEFNLKLGIAGFRALSRGVMQASYTTLRPWPMDYWFVE